jgi:hypothetical protein
VHLHELRGIQLRRQVLERRPHQRLVVFAGVGVDGKRNWAPALPFFMFGVVALLAGVGDRMARIPPTRIGRTGLSP